MIENITKFGLEVELITIGLTYESEIGLPGQLPESQSSNLKTFT